MKRKKIIALVAALAVSALGFGALSYFSGTAEKKENQFNIVAGQKDQNDAGTIQEPAQENGGKADAAAGLQPDQIVPKDPYIVSNVDQSAWAIMKVEVPKFTEAPNAGKSAAELLNVNADGKQKLLRELDDAEKHTVVYGYTEPLAGNNSTKPEAERAKTSSLFDSFKITGDISLANTYTGVIRVSGTLLQTEGNATVDDAAEGSGITPKSYAITYDLGEKAVLSGQKTRYTADDYGYTPPEPTREGYEFAGWSPVSIENGKTGDLNFTAQQNEKTAILLDGPTLNKRMKTLAGDASPAIQNKNDSILAIQKSNVEPSADIKASTMSLISTDNSAIPIYMQFDNGIIKQWSETEHVKTGTDLRKLCCNLWNLEDISGLADQDTSAVTNMGEWGNGTFENCKKLTDISSLANWDTSNVTSLASVFDGCSMLSNISSLENQNTNNVDDLSYLFSSCLSLTDISPLKNWNINNVTDLQNTFEGCESLTSLTPLANQNTSKVTNMFNIFDSCKSLTNLNGLENWDVSHIDTTENMFSYCENLTDITALAKWNPICVDEMIQLFSGCTNLSNLAGLENQNVSNVVVMYDSFKNCNLTDISALKNQDVSNVEEVDSLFEGNKNLADLTPLTNWNVSSVYTMYNMFAGCSSITDASALNNQNIQGVINDKYGSFDGMFQGCPSHPEFTKYPGTQSNGTFIPST